MGEDEERIKIIGSPDIDIMKGKTLPTIGEVKEKLGIFYDEYAILLFHPVVTELNVLEQHVNELIEACKQSGKNYIVIYPNNDTGSQCILKVYKELERETSFIIFTSVGFEDFLVLLQHAQFMIGNSSAGVREAPYFGVPTIDIGSRQRGRYSSEANSITHVDCDRVAILQAIYGVPYRYERYHDWGEGNSADLFMQLLNHPMFWDISLQKKLSY